MNSCCTSKILSYENAPAFFDDLRLSGNKIVQCHGIFNLLHSGHICHLKEAKQLGDILVITITAENFVNKGPGRPYLNESMRSESLAELNCVDFVVVIPHEGAVEAIECIKPDYYCKGKEYMDTNVDVTGNIHDDLKTVAKYSGKVKYIGQHVFSSTKLLNNHFDVHDPATKEFCKNIAQKYSVEDFKDSINSFKDIRVLVIGDTIFDKYSYLKTQGLTSKNQILSGRFIDEDMQAGGALAVYRHIKEFSSNVKIISLVGDEPWLDNELSRYIQPKDDLIIRDPNFTTVVKQRFIEKGDYEGKEITKLFAVNYIDEDAPPISTKEAVEKRITEQLAQVDMVLLIDFGHGLCSKKVREIVQEKAPYLALNCQTNSNNFGFNIINQRYERADSFSLDKQELLLAEGNRNLNYEQRLQKLAQDFGAQYGWLTRGGVSTIGVKDRLVFAECPPLERNIIDTVGAGDAFCAVASLAAYKNLPIDLATFIGQLGGGQAVRIVGNTQRISKANLLKSGMALLNF